MEEPNIIQPPSTLTPYALEEWQRLAPMARRLRTLKASTARSFELLVETLAIERKARELVERHGITIRTGHGGSAKPYPAVRTMETARVQAAALLKLFRLDPDQPPTAAPNPEKPRNSAWKGVLE